MSGHPQPSCRMASAAVLVHRTCRRPDHLSERAARTYTDVASCCTGARCCSAPESSDTMSDHFCALRGYCCPLPLGLAKADSASIPVSRLPLTESVLSWPHFDKSCDQARHWSSICCPCQRSWPAEFNSATVNVTNCRQHRAVQISLFSHIRALQGIYTMEGSHS